MTVTINGGNTRGPLAGFLGQLARPSDKEENKPTPLGFIGGIIGGAINELSTHAGNLAEHLAGQNPFFNGAWNNQGGISFPPGRPSDMTIVLSGWCRFCFLSFLFHLFPFSSPGNGFVCFDGSL